MRLSKKLRSYFSSISHCLATSRESTVDVSVAPLIWRAILKAKTAFLIFAGSLPMLLSEELSKKPHSPLGVG